MQNPNANATFVVTCLPQRNPGVRRVLDRVVADGRGPSRICTAQTAGSKSQHQHLHISHSCTFCICALCDFALAHCAFCIGMTILHTRIRMKQGRQNRPSSATKCSLRTRRWLSWQCEAFAVVHRIRQAAKHICMFFEVQV